MARRAPSRVLPRLTLIYREEMRGRVNSTRETRDPEMFEQWKRLKPWTEDVYHGDVEVRFYVGHIAWEEA